MDRRKLLSATVAGVSLLAVGTVTVPALLKSLSPARGNEPMERWQVVGKVDDFPIGGITKSIVELAGEGAGIDKTSVYVWRQTEDTFVVYSRSCTDLGCPVTWDPGSEWFYCPCHGGIFNKEGKREAGPPKRPLWRYGIRIRERILEINLLSVPPMV